MAKAAYDELGHGGGCEYCDDSVPHSHEDVRGPVETSRARAKQRTVVMLTVSALAAMASGIALFIAELPLSSALWTAATAVLGWLAATGIGVLAATRAGGTTPRGMAIGALVGAGLTPLASLGVALVARATDGQAWSAGIIAAVVWLLAGAVATAFQTRAWRRSLLEKGEIGERLRHIAVRKKGLTGRGEVLRWALQAALVGLATALLTFLPVTVVVLVPGAVALAAWAATRHHARR